MQTAFASNNETSDVAAMIEEILSSLELTNVEEIFSGLQFGESRSLINVITDLVTSSDSYVIDDFKEAIKNLFKEQLLTVAPTFGTILAIILFMAVVGSLRSEKSGNGILDVCIFIGNLVIVVLVLEQFIEMFLLTRNTMKSLSNIIQAFFPVILTLMTAAQGGNSVTVFKPIVGALCVGMTEIYVNILLPIIVLLTVFICVNSFSDTVKLNKMCDFLKSAFKWIVGITSVVFCFYVTAKGISSSVYDTVSIKALKYAVGNSVPLINTLINSGFDVVVASCVLIKNALGALSLIIIVFTVAVPVLRLALQSLIFRFIAAISESIADSKTVALLSGVGESISLLCVLQCVITIIYLVVILLIMCSLGVAF